MDCQAIIIYIYIYFLVNVFNSIRSILKTDIKVGNQLRQLNILYNIPVPINRENCKVDLIIKHACLPPLLHILVLLYYLQGRSILKK